jgi:integral membrane protein (TIGR01906 family)
VVDSTVARSLGSALIAAATAVTLIAIAVLAFLNPVWVGFEQVRTQADVFTGYPVADVHRVTDAVLAELIFGPATFLQQVTGISVFDPREREHLADVRRVLIGFAALAAASVVLLAVVAVRARDRGRVWRAVRGGAAVLAGAVVVVGALFAVFFDTMFDLFHRLLFAGGSYSFNPEQERLVQLFPEDFWAETSVALAVVILVLSLGVAWVARGRIAGAA